MIWMIAMIVVNELDTSGYVCGSHLSATLANISITVCENFIQVAVLYYISEEYIIISISS